MARSVTLTLPLPSPRAVRRCLVLSLVLLLSGSPPYPSGNPVRSWGVVGRVVVMELEGHKMSVTAETRGEAILLDSVLYRVGQGRPGYVYVPWPEAE